MGETILDLPHLPGADIRLVGWLGRAAFLDAELEASDVFEEAIVVAGRIANWLDVRMPRNAINFAMRAGMDAAA